MTGEDLSGSSTCSDVLQLLDQTWLFENIFNRASMVRSEVVDSFSLITEIVDNPVDEFSSSNHFTKDDAPPKSFPLLRIPSLPPRIENDKAHEEEGINCRLMNSNSQPTNHSLQPPSPSYENLSDSLKVGAAQMGIIPNLRPPRSSAVFDKAKSMDDKSKNHRSSKGRVKKYRSCKSLSDLEFEEVRGFMDLGFIFNKENLNSQVVNVIPGLQRLGEEDGMKGDEIISDTKVSRPYLSEAWLVHRPDSPILNGNMSFSKRQSGEDMKKHLKFWARAVASTVLLEC